MSDIEDTVQQVVVQSLVGKELTRLAYTLQRGDDPTDQIEAIKLKAKAIELKAQQIYAEMEAAFPRKPNVDKPTKEDEHTTKYDFSKLKVEEGSGIKVTDQGLVITQVLSDEEAAKLKLDFPTLSSVQFTPPEDNEIDRA